MQRRSCDIQRPGADCTSRQINDPEIICPPQDIAGTQKQNSIFFCAADILHETTLADGCIILGPMADTTFQSDDKISSGGDDTLISSSAFAVVALSSANHRCMTVRYGQFHDSNFQMDPQVT